MPNPWKSVCAAAPLFSAAPAWCVDVPVNADTYTVSNTVNNYGTQPTLNVSQSSGTGVQSNALLWFDLSSLPPGMTAADLPRATLALYLNKLGRQRARLPPDRRLHGSGRYLGHEAARRLFQRHHPGSTSDLTLWTEGGGPPFCRFSLYLYCFQQ
jgi:hypothetical protein